MNVLLVDDEIDLLDIIELTLEGLGLEIFKATNTDSAREIYNANKIDLIISDFTMPQIDGIRFLQEIRNKNPNLAFVLMSGNLDDKKVSMAESLNVSAVIHKPFDDSELLSLVKRISTKMA